jgi:hypothetical protein
MQHGHLNRLQLSWALALRSVRPLRLINRINSFRVISSSIVVAIKESSTIGVISFIFWLLLSLFGMQLFMGGLSHCTDPGKRSCAWWASVATVVEGIHHRTSIHTSPRERRLRGNYNVVRKHHKRLPARVSRASPG